MAEAAAAAYDSRNDTMRHISRVRTLLMTCVSELYKRAGKHDVSKLEEPEKSAFDRCTPALSGTEVGTVEYEMAKSELGAALEHHYAHNRHHPEHHERGIRDMNLIDVMEMFCDWKAAGERHASGGDIDHSITVMVEKYGIDDDLECILRNTARDMGWLKA